MNTKRFFRTAIAVISVMTGQFCRMADVSAQEPAAYVNAFDAEKAVWTYYFHAPSDGLNEAYIRKTVIDGDTLIDGTKWRIITGDPVIEKGLIRMDGQKVLIRCYPGYYWHGVPDIIGDEEIIMCDFSVNVGDSVWDRGVKRDIIETDSVMLLDGNRHKRLKYLDSGYCIEGLGLQEASPLALFHPVNTGHHDFEYQLVCCQVNDGLLYINPDFADCDGTPVANETVGGAPPKSGISFDGELLYVTFGGDTLFDVTVYNMQGVMIKQQKANRHGVTIPVQNLTQGVYVVRITSGGHTGVHRFIR
jgi:hypothetical protein